MQSQCNFNIILFVLSCFLFLFPRIKGTAFKMSADIYNSLVFRVSIEAAGPLQLKCHDGRKGWRTTEASVPLTAALYCPAEMENLLSTTFNPLFSFDLLFCFFLSSNVALSSAGEVCDT